MRLKSIGVSGCLALLLFVIPTGTAFAEGLFRVGPEDPQHGFPQWYQDTTGLALELCTPQNAAELDWCAAEPPDPGSLPEVPFDNWSVEHFYYMTVAEDPTTEATLELALESTFANEEAVDGDQMVFGRIRVRWDDAVPNATYRVYHPYGVFESLQADDRGRLRHTVDLGSACSPGRFDCVLAFPWGPFLTPVDANGNELPPVVGPSGKLHIAQPNNLHRVTGSPVGQNYFRVTRLQNGTETEIFTVDLFSEWIGRIVDNIPADISAQRASYTRSGDGIKLDVYATAFAGMQGRIPPNPPVPADTVQLSFFNAACGTGVGGVLTDPTGPGVILTPMNNTGNNYWGQILPDDIPASICIKDTTPGVTAPTYRQINVTDQVFITEALYSGGQLSIKATSSDSAGPPSLFYGEEELVNGEILLPMSAPPNRVTVVSEHGGSAEMLVSTTPATSTPVPPTANAGPDRTVRSADVVTLSGFGTGTSPLAYLWEQTGFGGLPPVTLSGSAQLNATFTAPFVDAPTVLTFQFTVSNSEGDAVDTISITVNPPAPPIVDHIEALSVTADQQVNITATGTDPGGHLPLTFRWTQTSGTPVVLSPNPFDGATISFTASLPVGTPSTTLQFQVVATNQLGIESAAEFTSVTINAAADTVTITQVRYRADRGRLTVTATSSVVDPGVVLTLQPYTDVDGNTVQGGPMINLGGGLYQIVLTGVTQPAGGESIRVTSSLGGSDTSPITRLE